MSLLREEDMYLNGIILNMSLRSERVLLLSIVLGELTGHVDCYCNQKYHTIPAIRSAEFISREYSTASD